jgi:hypothetical protein
MFGGTESMLNTESFLQTLQNSEFTYSKFLLTTVITETLIG